MTLAGLTIHDPDSLGSAPAQIVRTWDGPGAQRWCDVDTPKGYDLSGLTRFAKSGKRLAWVIGGTPTRYATTAVVDPYGTPGGWSATRNLSALKAYVSTVFDAIGPSIETVEVGNEIKDQFDLWAAMYEAVYEVVDGRALVCAASVDPGQPDLLGKFLSAFRRLPECVSIHSYNWDCSAKGLQKMLSATRKVVGQTEIIVSEMGLSPMYEGPGQVMPWRALGQKAQGNEWVRCKEVCEADGKVRALIWYDLDGYEAAKTGKIYPMGDKPGFMAGMNRILKSAPPSPE